MRILKGLPPLLAVLMIVAVVEKANAYPASITIDDTTETALTFQATPAPMPPPNQNAGFLVCSQTAEFLCGEFLTVDGIPVNSGTFFLPLLEPNGPTNKASDLVKLVITPNTDGTTTDVLINFMSDPETLLSIPSGITTSVVETGVDQALCLCKFQKQNGDLLQAGSLDFDITAASDVPEPSTLFILGSGLALIAAMMLRASSGTRRETPLLS